MFKLYMNFYPNAAKRKKCNVCNIYHTYQKPAAHFMIFLFNVLQIIVKEDIEASALDLMKKTAGEKGP